MYRSPLAIASASGACVGLLISAVLGVRQLAQEQAEAAFQPTVTAVTLTPGTIRSELVYAGVVQAPQQATITSLSAGTLTSMTANVGETVRSGDRLASFRGGGLRRLGLPLRTLGGVGEDAGDAHDRQILTMAVLAAIVLAALLLEDDDLVATRLLEHLGGDERASDAGLAEGRDGAVVKRENVGEIDVVAGVGQQLLDDDDVILGDFILLAAGTDDREHIEILFFQRSGYPAMAWAHHWEFPKSGRNI